MLKNNLGYDSLCGFLLKLNKTLLTFLLGSGLKFIFHWNAHLSVLFKSSFSSFVEALILRATEKRDVLSANSSVLKAKPWVKSFLKVVGSRGPRKSPGDLSFAKEEV